MSFEPGKPRHPNAGRKKGSPNKSTLMLLQKCQDANFDPVKEFFIRYQGVIDDEAACKLLLNFMEFIVPKRTRIEGEIEIGDGDEETTQIIITPENLIEMVRVARGEK